jgi:hypothetical protein
MKKRRKRPAKGNILRAISILEEMTNSQAQVHVAVFAQIIMFTFESKITKDSVLDEDWYSVEFSGTRVTLLPGASSYIGFSETGGFALVHDNISVTVEPEEHSPEELLELYPGTSRIIH